MLSIVFRRYFDTGIYSYRAHDGIRQQTKIIPTMKQDTREFVGTTLNT